MPVEILVPQLGESVYEGVIGRWLVPEGGRIKMDDPLLEIETDKITMEIPSPGEGIVVKQLAGPGQKVQVGELIGYIAAEGEEILEAPSVSKPPAEKAEEKPSRGEERAFARSGEAGAVLTLAEAETEPMPASRPEKAQETREVRDAGLKLSPVVARLISEYDLDPAKIKGTGIGGRIRKIDIEEIIADPARLAMAKRGAGPAPSAMPGAVPGARAFEAPSAPKVALPPIVIGEAQETIERQPLTTIRKTIISSLSKSYKSAVHTLTVDEADCTKMMEFLARYRDEVTAKYGVKLTVTAFFIKAVIQPLKDFPLVNAELDEEKEEIVLKKYYHIGFAADTEAGLVVPHIKHADRKGLIHIAAELQELAQKARERKLTLEEIHGATFTITNAGGFGAIMSAPIINYGNTAILGIHAVQKRPVVLDGQIVARDMCYLSMSFDHRVIDGVYAVKFLRAVCEQVENPERMLLW